MITRPAAPPFERESSARRPASAARLTNLRRAVLRTLQKENGPIAAYEILRRLSGELGRHLSPPSVYRSLDFLVREGVVTRIESLNAYLALKNAAPAGGRLFLLCDSCGGTTEVVEEDVSACLNAIARREGFAVESAAIELQGTCRCCQCSDLGDRTGAEART